MRHKSRLPTKKKEEEDEKDANEEKESSPFSLSLQRAVTRMGRHMAV